MDPVRLLRWCEVRSGQNGRWGSGKDTKKKRWSLSRNLAREQSLDSFIHDFRIPNTNNVTVRAVGFAADLKIRSFSHKRQKMMSNDEKGWIPAHATTNSQGNSNIHGLSHNTPLPPDNCNGVHIFG